MNKGDVFDKTGEQPIFDNFAEPPGVYIREELEARGWSQRDLAFILGYSEQTITKVISGKSGISAEMAKALGEAFGTSASLWAGLQKEWELREARDPDPSIKARAELQKQYPIREMISRGWFEEAEQSVLQMQFDRFFELEDNDNVSFAAAARKTHDRHSPEELAWLFRVRQLAREIAVPAYSVDKLRDALPRLRALMVDPEDIRFVPEILTECGVRFVIVEKLHNCKIDGVCTWIGDEPVIGVTVRHNRLDNFWFVLIHEIEHAVREHGKDGNEIIDSKLDDPYADTIKESDIQEQEAEADHAAKNFGFSHEKLLSFYRRKAPYIREQDVVGFSSLNEVHPAVVVGQIQFLKKDFAWLKRWLVPVRQHILPASIVDGFGTIAKASL